MGMTGILESPAAWPLTSERITKVAIKQYDTNSASQRFSAMVHSLSRRAIGLHKVDGHQPGKVVQRLRTPGAMIASIFILPAEANSLHSFCPFLGPGGQSLAVKSAVPNSAVCRRG